MSRDRDVGIVNGQSELAASFVLRKVIPLDHHLVDCTVLIPSSMLPWLSSVRPHRVRPQPKKHLATRASRLAPEPGMGTLRHGHASR